MHCREHSGVLVWIMNYKYAESNGSTSWAAEKRSTPCLCCLARHLYQLENHLPGSQCLFLKLCPVSENKHYAALSAHRLQGVSRNLEAKKRKLYHIWFILGTTWEFVKLICFYLFFKICSYSICIHFFFFLQNICCFIILDILPFAIFYFSFKNI